MNIEDREQLIARLIVLVVAFTIHELAHAVVAVRLGDPTPKKMGRLTLNPIAHLDPIGSIMILISGFGWAKPVTTQPMNYRINPLTGTAIVAIVGPISNILLALPFAALFRYYVPYRTLGYDSEPARVLMLLCLEFVVLNVTLAFFNFLPIPPLDGFKVLLGSLPPEMAARIVPFQRYGFVLLIILIFVLPAVELDVLDFLVWRPTVNLVNFLLGQEVISLVY